MADTSRFESQPTSERRVPAVTLATRCQSEVELNMTAEFKVATRRSVVGDSDSVGEAIAAATVEVRRAKCLVCTSKSPPSYSV
eukprot:3295325-Pleurochrysis_carterae.AAC.5